MAARRQQRKRPSAGARLRNAVLLGGVYLGAGALARYGYRTALGNKKLRATINKVKNAGKSGRWKKTLGKKILIGKPGKRMAASRRRLSAKVSTVKRRFGNTWGRKTTIKAGPRARSAFKRAPRNVVRGKVRSPSYAITRRR